MNIFEIIFNGQSFNVTIHVLTISRYERHVNIYINSKKNKTNDGNVPIALKKQKLKKFGTVINRILLQTFLILM